MKDAMNIGQPSGTQPKNGISLDQLDLIRDMIPVLGPGKEISSYRLNAFEIYQNTPMPTRSIPSWRRTDLKELDFSLVKLGKTPGKYSRGFETVASKGISGEIKTSSTGFQGFLNPRLRDQGVVFTDWLDAEVHHAELMQKKVGSIVPASDGKFAAMATAFANYGAFIYIPKGIKMEDPFLCQMNIADDEDAHFSHILIELDEDADITLILSQNSTTPSSLHSFHVGIVEVNLARNSKLRLISYQAFDDSIWNFTHEGFNLGENAELDWVFGEIGSRLTKTSSEIRLIGAGSKATAAGFYFSAGDQHFDLDTRLVHMAPSTVSNFIYKGALYGQSRSVWQGMIHVSPEAVKADGYQSNRNLILSHNARADSLPALEILADDVQCSHGATVGNIDEDQLFYLQSRGIPRRDAERLIVEGFFDPVIEKIPDLETKEMLHAMIAKKMDMQKIANPEKVSVLE
jgi:Fe-S cluster assembly protein SufD